MPDPNDTSAFQAPKDDAFAGLKGDGAAIDRLREGLGKVSSASVNPPPQLTLGEYRVGISFNPGGNPGVNEIKRRAADLIDLIERIPAVGQSADQAREIGRCKSLAQTHIEDAAMWAVKAATKPAR